MYRPRVYRNIDSIKSKEAKKFNKTTNRNIHGAELYMYVFISTENLCKDIGVC